MGTREFKRMSKGQSQTRTQFGRRVLGKCRGKEKVNNAVIIDVDSSEEHDFIIVDEPECSKKIFQSSRVSVERKKSPCSVIISIDDDDDDDVDELVNSDEVGGDVLRRAGQRNVSGNASDQSLSEESNSGHHGFTHESPSHPNVFKSKPRQSNCYGLYTDSDSSSSESDSSDVEVMEGSSGKIREQWERAASKKKMFDHVVNDQSNFKDQACASGSFADSSENAAVPKATEHCYRTNNGNGDGLIDNDIVMDSIYETGKKDNEFELPNEEDFVSKKRNMDDTHVNHDNYPVDKDEGLSTSYDRASTGVTCSMEKGKAFDNFDFGKACFLGKEKVSQEKTELQDTEACGSNSRKSDAAECNYDKYKTRDEDVGYFQETPCDRSNNGIACSMEKEKSVPRKTDFCNAQTSHISETFFEEKSSPANPLLCNDQEADTAHDIQNDLIDGREKYKETAEYKRAMEDEWASRQRELQNQAEEAQRLKKRRRAETARLLDMEKRQKQRLEEMRQTQKKDVETRNLKEEIRAKVRKELDKVEKLYYDMASLLRYLGINVRGGAHPMLREVHTAYKQALLKFHPDRASRNNIREQVEAEEKFKLISRLKEKLLPI
ncbi:hypothetical protein MKW98_002634 [Papaver atlanticum]|uniref:J domain-containing protein n=1 Tax=Papaver atlanticum TaxID=357466 RepID=A0AAD4XAM5_9MAGN|nr:hypothetical protein MKW98_002634 [Papaver atlanticum]